jgi:8-oxo-dGTP diphosphatase
VPSCLDGQLAMKWVHFAELDPEWFPDANFEIIAIIKNHLLFKERHSEQCLSSIL